MKKAFHIQIDIEKVFRGAKDARRANCQNKRSATMYIQLICTSGVSLLPGEAAGAGCPGPRGPAHPPHRRHYPRRGPSR